MAVKMFVVHFLGDFNVPTSMNGGPARTVTYGSIMTVNDAVIAAGKDRNGDCWVDLLDSPAAQITAYGRVMFARGPWPDDLSKLLPATREWDEERSRLIQEAFSLPDRASREAALERVRADFPQPTSKTLASYE